MDSDLSQLAPAFHSMTDFLISREFHLLMGTFAICLLILIVTRSYLNPILVRLVCRKNLNWIPVFEKLKTFRQLSFLFPALFFMAVSPYLIRVWVHTDRVVDAYVAMNITLLLASLIRTASCVYELYPIAKEKPMKSYAQLVALIIYVLGGVIVICQLTQTDPTVFLGGAVAVMAAILLVFRDTILSFIASMQLAANNLIKKGDWIEVPAFGADGNVIDIALHVVRVQNFDKTIVTVPTYKIIDSGFKNWRGMFESGGRQIKRSILIDLTSVRFITEEDLKFIYAQPTISKHLPPIEELENEHGETSPNAITNLGILRTYLANYLKAHPKINKGMTILVRILEPTPNGIPLQLYAYTDDTRWIYHEQIKGDVIEHTIALLNILDLKVFQNSMDTDFSVMDRITQRLTHQNQD